MTKTPYSLRAPIMAAEGWPHPPFAANLADYKKQQREIRARRKNAASTRPRFGFEPPRPEPNVDDEIRQLEQEHRDLVRAYEILKRYREQDNA